MAQLGSAYKCHEQPHATVHCKLDKVGHGSLCPPRNGTGVVLLEATLCRVSLKEMSGSSYLSPYSKMSNFYAAVAYPQGCGESGHIRPLVSVLCQEQPYRLDFHAMHYTPSMAATEETVGGSPTWSTSSSSSDLTPM